MSVKRLDGRVDVQSPRLFQQRFVAGLQMLLQPCRAFLRVHALQGTPHRILARCFLHAQQSGVYSIAPNRTDVRIAPMSRQHRQQDRSQHIPLLRRVRARKVQRAFLHPGVKQTTGFQKLNEKCHLPQTAHRSSRHPFHLDLAPERVQAQARRHRFVSEPRSLSIALTRRVNSCQRFFVAHLQQYALLICSHPAGNCCS